MWNSEAIKIDHVFRAPSLKAFEVGQQKQQFPFNSSPFLSNGYLGTVIYNAEIYELKWN